jgi:hypothetical protein
MLRALLVPGFCVPDSDGKADQDGHAQHAGDDQGK